MKLLIISESFPPETKSSSTLFFELAESLVKRGHKVSVVTRMPRYNVASGVDLGKLPLQETLSGVKVYRLRTPPLMRNIPFVRGLEHFMLAFIFFFGALKRKDFDIILLYSPPLPLGVVGCWLARIRNKPIIINVQDLFPQGVIELGLLKNKILVKIARFMESFIYDRPDFITVHSEGSKQYVVSKGGKEEAVAVVHNWVDTEAIKPGAKINPFSREHGLTDKFVVSFAGTMGFAQGLEVVVRAADKLRDLPDIRFVLVGDGVKRKELENLSDSLKLQNLIFIQTQPLAIYPQILAASDICLITLPQKLKIPAVPGKLPSIMAAGRAVVASVPLGGDAPKIIEGYDFGICVEPGNPEELAKAIVKLYNDLYRCEELGRNGRKAAENDFSLKKAVLSYERIINRVLKEQQHV